MKRITLATLVFILLYSYAQAFDLTKKEPPVTLTLSVPQNIRAGQTGSARIDVQIRKPWHLFSQTPEIKGVRATQFTLQPSAAVAVEKIEYSTPKTVHSPVFNKDLALYEDALTITLTLKISAGQSGKIPLEGTFEYQACSDTTCLPPAKQPFSATLEVSP
jgi:thioredoxin:protein disulfide reductase